MTEQEIQKLIADYTALRNDYKELSAKYATMKEEFALMQQQMDWLRKQMFGRKTEQTSVIMEGGTQLSMFSDENENKSEKAEKAVTIAEHKRKKKRTHDDWMSNLPVQEVVHEEEHPVCEKCGSEMKEIGSDKAYDELVYTPGKYYIRRHIVKSYKCPKCGENPENDAKNEKDIEKCHIRRADYPRPMIPGSFCSPELLAHIIYEKYAKAVPLYRQESDLASKHIYLLRATMSNWVDVAAKEWFMPIADHMHELLLLSLRFPQVNYILFSDQLSRYFLQRMIYSSTNFSVLLKDCSIDETQNCLLKAAHGEQYVCQRVIGWLESPEKAENTHSPLTSTEREILKSLSMGRTTKEIASERCLSVYTIMTHRKNIFRKLGVNNAQEAIRYALRAGIVDPMEYYI